MTLSDLASLGSFVSGVAVLVSLAFLFVQMRQMTEQARQAERHQRAAIRQGQAAILIDLNLRIAENHSDTFGPLMRGETVSNVDQLRRFMAIELAGFQLHEEQFDQYRECLLSDSSFAGLQQQIRMTMRMSGHRVAWTFLRQRFEPDFAALVDQIFAEVRADVQVDLATVENWNRRVAAESAKARS